MQYHFKNLLLLLCLLFCVGTYAQTSTTESWKTIHKVKKQETIFGIAKDYGITIEALIDANPEMKEPGYQLKKGEWVFVPYAKKGDKNASAKKEGREMLVEQAARPVRSNVVKIGYMLPFHLEDADGERMVEYYQGMRLALDSLKKQNLNAEITVWNLAKDSSVVKVLSDPRAFTLDVIFGPLYSEQLPALSEFCKTHGIKLFVPCSIEGSEIDYNPQVMQVYQTKDQLQNRTISAFIERFRTSHQPIIIDCNNPSDGKVAFTSALRQKLAVSGMNIKVTNINTPMADFQKQFSRTMGNVIVLNTARSPELNRVYAKLDSLTKQNPGLTIAMFGYNEWFMYQKHDLSYFFKYNTYIPTTYYYNAASARTVALENDFKTRWGQDMMPQCTPRMGLMGYDHTMYIVNGIHTYGKDFVGADNQSSYRPLQTPLSFVQVNQGGGYQNDNFQLIHFRTDQKLESLTY